MDTKKITNYMPIILVGLIIFVGLMLFNVIPNPFDNTSEVVFQEKNNR